MPQSARDASLAIAVFRGRASDVEFLRLRCCGGPPLACLHDVSESACRVRWRWRLACASWAALACLLIKDTFGFTRGLSSGLRCSTRLFLRRCLSRFSRADARLGTLQGSLLVSLLGSLLASLLGFLEGSLLGGSAVVAALLGERSGEGKPPKSTDALREALLGVRSLWSGAAPSSVDDGGGAPAGASPSASAGASPSRPPPAAARASPTEANRFPFCPGTPPSSGAGPLRPVPALYDEKESVAVLGEAVRVVALEDHNVQVRPRVRALLLAIRVRQPDPARPVLPTQQSVNQTWHHIFAR